MTREDLVFWIESKFREHSELSFLSQGNFSLTYQAAIEEIICRSELLQDAIGEDGPVALLSDHSHEGVLWLLSAFYGGIPVVPLNSDLPESEVSRRISEFNAVATIGVGGIAKIEAKAGGNQEFQGTNLFDSQFEEPVVYGVYTSGSTGLPKLVCVGADGLINLAQEQASEFGMIRKKKTLQFAPLSFDAAIAEIFSSIAAGCELVIPERLYPAWLSDVISFLGENFVDFATFPPSVYGLLPERSRKNIDTVIFAGESLNYECFRKAKESNRRIFNAYGPSEATVCVTLTELHEFSDEIGNAINGFTLHVREHEDSPLLKEGKGELIVEGPGVALGYLNQPSNKSFWYKSGRRFYATGDSVILSNDRVVFLGRRDREIKRFGHRINLDGLTQRINEIAKFNCALLYLKDRLVAIFEEGKTPSNLDLFETLASWEQPDLVTEVDIFPLTDSGKLDISRLEDLLDNDFCGISLQADGEESNFEVVDRIVSNILNFSLKPGISVFDAGGSSLTMVQLQAALGEVFGTERVTEVFAKMDHDFFIDKFIDELNALGKTEDYQALDSFSSAIEIHEKWCRDIAKLAQEPTTLYQPSGRVILTGASGFIGGETLRGLIEKKKSCAVVTTSDVNFFGNSLTAINYDDLNSHAAQKLLAGSDIIHAGFLVNHMIPLHRQIDSSLYNTKILIESAIQSGARSFLFLSASSIPCGLENVSESMLRKIEDPYSQAKFLGEFLVDAAKVSSLHTGVLRLGLVYQKPGRSTSRLFLKDTFASFVRACKQVNCAPMISGGVPITTIESVSSSMEEWISTQCNPIVPTYWFNYSSLIESDYFQFLPVSCDEWLQLVSDAGVLSPTILIAVERLLKRETRTKISDLEAESIVQNLIL